MNLYHLKYFYDSARLGSITKASQLNRVGQPAISKGIQNLEGVFGKTLISHARNRFQLTEDGEIIFSYCKKIFSATDELRDSLSKKSIPSGVVRLACQSSMAQSDFFTEAIRAINTKYPKIDLKLALGRTDLVRDWVKNGIIDFGLVLDNVDIGDFDVETILSGTFRLVQSKDYDVNWHDEGILTIEGKREVQELKKKYESIYNRELKIKMEVGSWGVIEKFVSSGIGAGFLPDFIFRDKLRARKLICIESKKLAVPYTINLIRKSDHYLPDRCRHVMTEILDRAKRI